MRLAAGLAMSLASAMLSDGVAAEAQLAGIFGHHMVLQRGAPIAVWGTAAPGERVQVRLAQRQAEAIAGGDGRWHLRLAPLPAGGPHVLKLRASNAVELHDVLIGDVWLASGQSNMEWTLAQSQDAAADVAAADAPLLRHVKVPRRASLATQADMASANWQVSTPATAGSFSSVAYHFARRLQRELGPVPIGIVNNAVGGSHVETWMSPEAARADPLLTPVMNAMPADVATLITRLHQRQHAVARRWQGELPLWPGAGAAPWSGADIDDSSWPELQAPGIWEDQGLPGFDGTVWLRRRITLNAAQAASAATLRLGAIDDCDETWLNGQKLGATCGWDQPRAYAVPESLLRAGENLIAVRVLDTGGGGGFHGDAAALRLELHGAQAMETLPLAGHWKARVEAPYVKQELHFNDLPTLLFNGMARPLTPMALRGVIWYQGESNVPRAAHYIDAFPRLIADWRAQWRQPALPFYYVQLASFLPLARNTLQGSDWAELREAQRLTLRVPGTGMAVATDVGDANDIHPRNKRPVGERLAALALRRTYGRSVVDSGPELRHHRVVSGGRIELQFAHAHGGLSVRGGAPELQGFAIAGADQRFVAAQARVQGSRVLVWSAAVPAPVAVRYGWVHNPEQSNLVNRAGLPASPFRTDDWPWRTLGVKPPF